MPAGFLAFEEAVGNAVDEMAETPYQYQNISKKERQATMELPSEQDIIIKPANKGGAIVILPIDMYRQEFLKLLNQERNYKRLTRDTTPDMLEEIEFLVERV
ncbi:hypothetical protein NDU88_003768 [Pleurodeles waltl]|uniref:Type II toxin-antitoxin system Phd/YefM family antitoxin n=1 Tax=Pleurodeles waltl TaxID=8319 RepID=A0AAV7SGV6_PLEWA|nr:hypothetical protein NDU88_003768 [Pleurodeles waltl]